jgi:peptidoglycan/xylan/chitin deacetylase (PgdA/CDA1 family)
MSLIILNFHGVGPVTRDVDAGEHNCWLDQDHFETVLDLVRGQSHVQLTFDDGNASDWEIAMPALVKRGLKATFFICSGRLDQPTFLSPAQLRELQANGMAIGSHGVDHLPWRTLPAAHLNNELAQSKTVLEKVCGCLINSAACPFGSYDRRVLKNLRCVGYRHVYTSDGGSSSEHEWLHARTTVTRSMPLESIRQTVKEPQTIWRQASINIKKIIKRIR